MADWLVIIVDLLLVVMFIFNLYWQAQIFVPAKYKISSAILAAVLAIWMWSWPLNSWLFIILEAAFLTLIIMQGTGGIGKKRLVINGLFANVISYQKISHITLIPVQLLDTKPQVISVFTTVNRQNIQMTFMRSVDELKQDLRKVIPQSIEIEIAQI